MGPTAHGLDVPGYTSKLIYDGGANGIVAAVRNGTCTLRRHHRVARRVAGLEVESKVDGRCRRVAIEGATHWTMLQGAAAAELASLVQAELDDACLGAGALGVE